MRTKTTGMMTAITMAEGCEKAKTAKNGEAS
jgi:hypothetical protein